MWHHCRGFLVRQVCIQAGHLCPPNENDICVSPPQGWRGSSTALPHPPQIVLSTLANPALAAMMGLPVAPIAALGAARAPFGWSAAGRTPRGPDWTPHADADAAGAGGGPDVPLVPDSHPIVRNPFGSVDPCDCPMV